MIILIGNYKGGAGKSTITLLLANYLTQEKGYPVTVIDMDEQQSITRKFEKAKQLENKVSYHVIPARLENFPALLNLLRCGPRAVTLIDLTTKLNHSGLVQVFQSADLVICPFAYDEFSYESTIFFNVLLRKINPAIPVLFVPNRIKGNPRGQAMLQVNAQLTKFGKVSPALADRADFQRISTTMIPAHLLPLVAPVFDPVYSQLIAGPYAPYHGGPPNPPDHPAPEAGLTATLGPGTAPQLSPGRGAACR